MVMRAQSAQRVTDSPIRKVDAETLTVNASNGTRTAVAVRLTPNGLPYQELLIKAILASRLKLVPAIKSFLFWDDSELQWKDELQRVPLVFDRVAGVDTTILGAMTSSDYFYLGFANPVGGFVVDVGGTPNANAAVLTCEYSDAGHKWTAITITDGTISAAKTLAIDGNVTWTAPADGVWRPANIRELPSPQARIPIPPNLRGGPLYWMRFKVDATLTAGLILTSFTPLAVTAAGTDDVAAATGGMLMTAATEYTMDIDPSIGALELIAVAAGATTAQASWISR